MAEVLYGHHQGFPVLERYRKITNTVDSPSEGPRLVSLWRFVNRDSYLRLANADHEAQTILSEYSEDVQLNDGVNEPNRFLIHSVDTTADIDGKCWEYPVRIFMDPIAIYYETSYPVSWWDERYGQTGAKAYMRFRPALGVYWDETLPELPPQTRAYGFGLVQFYGSRITPTEAFWGCGVVAIVRVDTNRYPAPVIDMKKFWVVFQNNSVVYYRAIDPPDSSHTLRWEPSTGWTLVDASWVGMRPQGYSQDGDVNIEFCYWSSGAHVDSPVVLTTLGPFQRYTTHSVYLVQRTWTGSIPEHPADGGAEWGVGGTIGGMSDYQPASSITPPPIYLKAALYQVESAFRSYPFYVPLDISNPSGNPYRVRLQSATRYVPYSQRFLEPPDHLLSFRGTDNASDYPNNPEGGTRYDPYVYASSEGPAWYRPVVLPHGDPAHKFWWVQYRLMHDES